MSTNARTARLCAICLGLLLFASAAHAIPGDADGNGVVNIEDARCIARFLVNQIPAIPRPVDADVTQDGKVDIEDAFVIAKRVNGQSLIVLVAAPIYGRESVLPIGDIVRVRVFEHFAPFNITGGTVRIRSASKGYDSGDQHLTFERDGRSLYYDWPTGGLAPSSDYEVSVALTNPVGLVMKASGAAYAPAASSQPAATATLTNRVFEPKFVAASVDASCPAPGIPLEFRRVAPNDHAHYPYLGPLGRGWNHNYDISLEEFTNGKIAFHGPEGFNRFFQSNADGTYSPTPGDYATLTRDPSGVYQLKERDGFIYCFRPDLKFNYEQDLNGNRISGVYDGSGRSVEIRHSCGKSLHLEYNSRGRISKLTDHIGRAVTFEYDTTGQMLLRATDPAGGVTEYAYVTPQIYCYALGIVPVGGGSNCVSANQALDYRILTVKYPDGTFTQYQYDTEARLTRQTGTWGANPTNYSYDADGTTHVTDSVGAQVTLRVNDNGQPLSVVDPGGSQTEIDYNAAGNLIGETDPLGRLTQLDYDSSGNVTSVTNALNETVQYGYDLRFNKPSYVTDPLGRETKFDYDTYGQLIAATYQDGSVESYAYDAQGNLVSVTDAEGRVTQHTYSAQALLTSTTNALGNATAFAYNAFGDLTSVTDAKSHAVALTRDTLGRLTRRTYPDGSHEDYEYDTGGKVRAFANRRGERTTFAYDAAGRLTEKTYASGKAVHYQYDPRGLLSRVETISGGVTSFGAYYEYDLERRTTVAKSPGKNSMETYDVAYAYDAAGNRKAMVYPDGYLINYEYDAANRLKRISDSVNKTIVAYDYDAAGRRTKRTLGNGTYATYEYDTMDRLTTLVNYSPSGAVQSHFQYTHNKAGIRTSMTTLEGTHSYTYDNAYQLTGVQYPAGRTVTYSFDKAGNRASVNDNGVPTTYATNALDQYTSAGAETFTYDADGNLASSTKSGSTVSYGWDEDDRLVSVSRNGVQISYRYDSRGRLVSKTIGGLETRYVWDGVDLIAEMNSAGQLTKRFVYGAAIDEIALVSADSASYWCQQDGLGSVIGTTNGAGSVVATCSYDVYGNVRSGDLAAVPQRFAGMRWDANAGLYYVRSRWYSPGTGRFVSVDPLDGQNTSNCYAYSRNSPLSCTDPSGLRTLQSQFSQFGTGVLQVIGGGITAGVGIAGTAGTAGASLFLTVTGAYTLGSGMMNIVNSFSSVDNSALITGGIFSSVSLFSNNKDVHTWGKIADYGQSLLSPSLDKILYKVPNWLADLPDIVGAFEDTWDSLVDIGKSLNDGGSGTIHRAIGPDNGFGGGYGGGGGGTCPTFVQGGNQRRASESNIAGLSGRIEAPWPGSLLRSDIPIYGIAAGSDFKSYRVEYGEGTSPSQWHLIAESDKLQEKCPSFKDISWMQGDLNLAGNLATWNTGLKNWEHLPWHPAEDAIDLNGVYTIRLVVTGKDGKEVEDKITCEVGRAIAQCLPGIAVSPDRRVTMRFPEQSLTHPFRVYTILPLSDAGEDMPAKPKGFELVGPAYRVREPGDKFIKDVSLEFTPKADELSGRDVKRVGMCRYDTAKKEWVWLETTRENGAFLVRLSELPSPRAIYALAFDPNAERSSPAKPAQPPATVASAKPGVFVDDTFEQDMGSFKARDRLVGATLARDNTARRDGSYCLKLENENQGGNFSCTVVDTPFDIKEYPLLSFDYRVRPDVKADLYLKANGRWYNVGFTDDPVDYRHKDVNIANLGVIQGVTADDNWHTAKVDLRMLSQQTRQTRIDEIMVADWDLGGYMSLAFGNNARGSVLYLDNIKISGPTKTANSPDVIAVDDFDGSTTLNSLGGASGTYSNPGCEYVKAVVDPKSGNIGSEKGNRSIRLSFDVTNPDAYAGYWTSIDKLDLSDYSTLRFRMRSDDKDAPQIIAGIRTKSGVEGRAPVAGYMSAQSQDGWYDVGVPLSAMRGLFTGPDLVSPDILFLAASNKEGSGKGAVRVDDVTFDRSSHASVADFESGATYSLLGGDLTTGQNGAGSVSWGCMPDASAVGNAGNQVCRISYGGSIGTDYGAQGGFSYCYWQCDLNGNDARPFKYLSMKVRGEKGGETPNFYLCDGSRRVCLRARDTEPITTEWKTLRLPLSFFADKGIDLSRLDSLQIVFEWTEQSGTILVDDIRFGTD